MPDEQLSQEAEEIQANLKIDMVLFFAHLKEINHNKELTNNQKRYISLSLQGYDGLDLAKLDYQKLLVSQFPHQPEKVQEKLRNKSRDIRSYMCHEITPIIRNFIAERLNNDRLLNRMGIPWGMLVIELLKKGYRIENVNDK